MRIFYTYNEALMKRPYDDPIWDGWKVLVDKVHEELQVVDGFLGFLDGTKSDAGYLQPYPDRPLVMGNLAAWSSEMTMHHWTHSGTHGKLLEHRARWFHPWPNGGYYGVIWVDHDYRPKFNLDYAKEMLGLVQRNGPDEMSGLYGIGEKS